MSKTYTIPVTDAIPLPTLPITFPNLALYLQAALDTSRRHLNDSPTGPGKLGKMVQMCYLTSPHDLLVVSLASINSPPPPTNPRDSLVVSLGLS